MKTSSAVLALDFTDPAILAARKVREVLDQAEGLDRPHLLGIMTQCYGSTAADGRWSLRDAYDVLELAQVLYLTTADLPDHAAHPHDRMPTRQQYRKSKRDP